MRYEIAESQMSGIKDIKRRIANYTFSGCAKSWYPNHFFIVNETCNEFRIPKLGGGNYLPKVGIPLRIGILKSNQNINVDLKESTLVYQETASNGEVTDHKAEKVHIILDYE